MTDRGRERLRRAQRVASAGYADHSHDLATPAACIGLQVARIGRGERERRVEVREGIATTVDAGERVRHPEVRRRLRGTISRQARAAARGIELYFQFLLDAVGIDVQVLSVAASPEPACPPTVT